VVTYTHLNETFFFQIFFGRINHPQGFHRHFSAIRNVITIKDQWKKDSDKTYTDRLGEQLEIFARLVTSKCIIGGDFNLRLGWPQKRRAHQRVKEFVDHHGLVWPTETQTDTVQHVIHSPELTAKVTIDLSVQHTKGNSDKLSDHPFPLIDVQDA